MCDSFGRDMNLAPPTWLIAGAAGFIGMHASLHLLARGDRVGQLERYKPSPLNFVFKDLTNKNKLIVSETTRISLLDFETYIIS